MTVVNARLDTVTVMAIVIVAVLPMTLVTASRKSHKGDVRSHKSVVKEDGRPCELSREAMVGYLSDACAGASVVNVRYGDIVLDCGQTMTVENTASPPKIVFPDAIKKKRYTAVLVDPDAPGSNLPDLKFYLHWILTDIKGADMKSGNMTGKSISKYFGPHPPAGTGPHHYTLIVFETTSQRKITLSDSTRAGFSLINFINDNNICHLVSTFKLLVEG